MYLNGQLHKNVGLKTQALEERTAANIGCGVKDLRRRQLGVFPHFDSFCVRDRRQ